MPIYHFYRIVPKDVVDADEYIGSTRSPLHKRWWEHCRPDNRTTSRILFERYGKENLCIRLIHSLDLPSKEYALREERRLYEESVRKVNQVRPWVSPEEKREENIQKCRQYYRLNREAHIRYCVIKRRERLLRLRAIQQPNAIEPTEEDGTGTAELEMEEGVGGLGGVVV